ncbi:protein kinase family protein [Floccifex sp.]|uniref:protein kinase family protein n=1 Tax=Floccifex sp. TaxID=2815810 RepID=UPI002A74A5C0|nr:protein kinase family protein [Floccifex sp.]MDD7280855.1 protein kinase family protein [Erysipelotrichaceae bacterium]MDY2958319.1 protein kinase family protein [Floccifex sp.]
MKEWNNRYLWLSNIKYDSFIRVDLVQDQITGKKCIAKAIKNDAPSIYIHQFRMEIKVLSMIQHPYMPHILDVFEEHDSLILIESYVEAQNFQDWTEKHPFQLLFLKDIFFFQALNLIDYLHQFNLLYIDIKTENFLISKYHLYLIDFNACVYNESKQIPFSSPSNHLPEQLDNQSKTMASDVYALGKFFETISLFKIPLIKKCTHKNPNKRFQSFSTLKKVLILHMILKAIVILILSASCLSFMNQGKEAYTIQRFLLNPEDETLFMEAYMYDLQRQEGAYYEKCASVLYQWICDDYFSDCLENEKISEFIMKQVIICQNPIYCEYFLKHIPKHILIQYKELTSFMKQIMNGGMSDAFANEYITYLFQTKSYETLSTYMYYLISNQIILDDIDLLYEINIEIKQDFYDFDKCSLLYCEYCLFLKEQNQCRLPIPELYTKSNNEEVQQLLRYLERK